MESVFDLCTQARRTASDPLAQSGLGDAVVFDLGITLWVCAHPQLEERKDSLEQVGQVLLQIPDHCCWKNFINNTLI